MLGLVDKRYILEEPIGQGGMGDVYRATDRLATNTPFQTVALKRVRIVSENPEQSSGASMDFRLALAQEFRTLSTLRHPNIISVLDYGFDEQNTPYYTMDYLENAQTILEAAAGKPLNDKVRLLVQIAQALEYLHRRGIIHRDLKPANVLVIDNQVKVLDFGLAIGNDDREEAEELAGTLGYMAPEMLIGSPASVATDLYAFGTLVYEVIAGKHPFNIANHGELIYEVLNKAPDIASLDISEAFAATLTKLLAKDPADRFANATEILRAYNTSLGRKVVYESDSTRDSFIQAARFVGRQRELGQLTDALNCVLSERKGSAWLIAGESGVGKSRLLEEVRAHGQVRGMRVLRGQGVIEKTTTYRLWRDILRWLAISADLSDFEASVLKPLIPDIDILILDSVPDAPDVAPEAAQDRLLNVIEGIFKRQTEPLLLVLEDLHWARESLKVLNTLTRMIDQLPVMIIGTFRDEEAPHLPSQFENVQTIKLERLSEAEIAALSESMLGENGKLPEVVGLLQRETEGNVFFLVEVVRELAEDAGRLDLIGSRTLPQKIFAGGVQLVIEQRLKRVPGWGHLLLKFAALIGRQIDLPVLKALAQTNPLPEEASFDLWLHICSDAAVFDVMDGQWRFAHDKLREGILGRIRDGERRQLHAQIAAVMETLYPENYTLLAYHFGQAANVEREAYYAGFAGEQALENGAYQTAIELMERALKAETITDERRARIEQQLSGAFFGIGQLPLSREHAEKALALLGYPMPATQTEQIIKLVRQMARQVVHRYLPVFFGRKNDRREVLIAASSAHERLAVVNYMSNNVIQTILGTFYSVNLAEQAGASPQLARAYVNLGLALDLIPMHKTADNYMKRALEMVGDSPEALSWALTIRCAHNHGMGRLQQAVDDGMRAGEIALEIGSQRGFEDTRVITSSALLAMGRLDEALAMSKGLYQNALKRGDLHNTASGMALHLAALYHSGQFEAIGALWKKLEPLLERGHDYGHKIAGYGISALYFLNQGDKAQALKNSEKILQIILKEQPTSYYSIIGYSSTTELYLRLWEQGETQYAGTAAQLMKKMKKFASVFPFAQPTLQRLQAWYNRLK